MYHWSWQARSSYTANWPKGCWQIGRNSHKGVMDRLSGGFLPSFLTAVAVQLPTTCPHMDGSWISRFSQPVGFKNSFVDFQVRFCCYKARHSWQYFNIHYRLHFEEKFNLFMVVLRVGFENSLSHFKLNLNSVNLIQPTQNGSTSSLLFPLQPCPSLLVFVTEGGCIGKSSASPSLPFVVHLRLQLGTLGWWRKSRNWAGEVAW